MTEGDVALTPLPQADGRFKPRPAILLRRMPPFGDWLICGVSSQLHRQIVDFDEIIEPSHSRLRAQRPQDGFGHSAWLSHHHAG